MSCDRQRRRVVKLIGVGTVAAVAGCLGSNDDRDDSNGNGDDDQNGSSEASGSGEPDGDPETPENEDLTYGDVLEYESSFAVDLVLADAEGTQLNHGEDYHVEIETDDGEVVEMYGVDGDHYIVTMGHCERDSRDPEEGQHVDTDQEPDDDLANLPVEGTTTIDGEEVYVFDDAGETKYVSAETGYPVRFDWETGYAVFHSWGEVGPISPPDNCVE